MQRNALNMISIVRRENQLTVKVKSDSDKQGDLKNERRVQFKVCLEELVSVRLKLREKKVKRGMYMDTWLGGMNFGVKKQGLYLLCVFESPAINMN